MGDENREISRLWRVNRTIHELVNDRGFQVSDEEMSMSLETFKDTYAPHGNIDRGSLNFFTNSRKDAKDQIFVFFADEKSVGIKTMRKFVQIIDEKSIQRGIIIYPTNMTPTARKVLTSMGQDYILEEFAESELLVNITRHKLVPHHEIMTQEDTDELLNKYRLKSTQLPRIQITDPVCRYYGVKRGQVVRIIRPSETSGRYASYRMAT